MSYRFGKLWHLATIWAIRKAFQCILQGVRFLLAKHTRLSPTSENDSYGDNLGKGSNNQNGNLRWFLLLGVRPSPPPLMGQISRHFLPHFFLLQLNPAYMKRILHFKNITLKSSYNWFKIDIHQQLRPLTANYLAMFKVISTTINT